MRNPLLTLIASLLAIQVFVVALLAAVFGGNVGRAVLFTVVEFLEPFVVFGTVSRVWRHPPEGAKQLRTLYAVVRRRERPGELGLFLLATELLGAAVGIVGFAGVVFFTELPLRGLARGPSLANLLGYGSSDLVASTASLALFFFGVVVWTSSWVLEGLSVTATNGLPR